MATEAANQSSWRSKLRAMGPGILMASAAVGGSHIVASTQAGAIYGWQLMIIIILANLFKYPFFPLRGAIYPNHRQNPIRGIPRKRADLSLGVFYPKCLCHRD